MTMQEIFEIDHLELDVTDGVDWLKHLYKINPKLYEGINIMCGTDKGQIEQIGMTPEHIDTLILGTASLIGACKKDGKGTDNHELAVASTMSIVLCTLIGAQFGNHFLKEMRKTYNEHVPKVAQNDPELSEALFLVSINASNAVDDGEDNLKTFVSEVVAPALHAGFTSTVLSRITEAANNLRNKRGE